LRSLVQDFYHHNNIKVSNEIVDDITASMLREFTELPRTDEFISTILSPEVKDNKTLIDKIYADVVKKAKHVGASVVLDDAKDRLG
jgi:hypothetical protein